MVAARVSSRKFPPKFKLSTWAIWSAFTAKISNSSTKQMCAESGFGALQESARATSLARVLVAEGYYPKLNNNVVGWLSSQKVVIMEDVDEETVKFLHHHLKIWGFGLSPMVFGVWVGGLGEGGRFLEPAFLPWNSGPPVLRGRWIRSERFYWSLRG